ncbi:MAG TPA: hypothetical protein VK961_10925 [Chthoniobacter sp.]|nr:hypothetical protein [Chthoniobacter sp.]
MAAAKLAEGIRRLKVDTAFLLERLIDECQAGGDGIGVGAAFAAAQQATGRPSGSE